MRIGFDVSQTAENMAGCGYFSNQVITHLTEQDKENDYLLYSAFYDYRHPNYKKATKINQSNATTMFVDLSWDKLHQVWNDLKVNRGQLLGMPDLVHSNNYRCPKDIDAKKIVTIYDMCYIDHPEYTTEANRIVCLNGAFESSVYADQIITISEFSKRQFLKHFPHYPDDRISVVYLGTRPSLFLPEKNKRDWILKKMGIASSFWLGVGTIEPRKNYRLLIEAYSEYVKHTKDPMPLYIAGANGWLEDDIEKLLIELRVENLVRFLGYVTDEELSVLYSSCYSFIYPSHYEGFGLPVLEAMSVGAPVIVSNTSSLPEVAGDAGIYIDPKHVSSLVQAMSRLAQEEGLREMQGKMSVEQSKKFTWDKAAKEIRSIYEKVLSNEPWFVRQK